MSKPKKKYHARQWKGLTTKERREYTDWMVIPDLPETYIWVRCAACDKVITKRTRYSWWIEHLTRKDQEHNDSPEHKQAILLIKLAGT